VYTHIDHCLLVKFIKFIKFIKVRIKIRKSFFDKNDFRGDFRTDFLKIRGIIY